MRRRHVKTPIMNDNGKCMIRKRLIILTKRNSRNNTGQDMGICLRRYSSLGLERQWPVRRSSERAGRWY